MSTQNHALRHATGAGHEADNGQALSITDLAEQEGVTDAYVCPLLPLNCLAPASSTRSSTGGSRGG